MVGTKLLMLLPNCCGSPGHTCSPKPLLWQLRSAPVMCTWNVVSCNKNCPFSRVHEGQTIMEPIWRMKRARTSWIFSSVYFCCFPSMVSVGVITCCWHALCSRSAWKSQFGECLEHLSLLLCWTLQTRYCLPQILLYRNCNAFRSAAFWKCNCTIYMRHTFQKRPLGKC